MLAVASFGGHLVQLERVMRPLTGDAEVVWAVTSPQSSAAESAPGRCIAVADFSRRNAWLAPLAMWRMASIIRSVRPACVITTGAAPGLVAVIVARMLGVRSLWIDSLANAERLSLSGRIAAMLATEVLTQWPHLAAGKIKYCGSII